MGLIIETIEGRTLIQGRYVPCVPNVGEEIIVFNSRYVVEKRLFSYSYCDDEDEITIYVKRVK